MKTLIISQAWWHVPIIPALEKVRQEDCQVLLAQPGQLSNLRRCCFKKKQNKTKNKTNVKFKIFFFFKSYFSFCHSPGHTPGGIVGDPWPALVPIAILPSRHTDWEEADSPEQ